ncbi:MAG: hypothetical protein IPO81_26545 [Kouleothrix sp.]|nr:hypothetical protein [Kouleothrix sp.]
MSEELHEQTPADDLGAGSHTRSWPGTASLARIQRAIERRTWVTTILVIALGAAVGANLRYTMIGVFLGAGLARLMP